MYRSSRTAAVFALIIAGSNILAACQGDLSTGPQASARATRIASNVAVCHGTGNGTFRSLSVAPSAVDAHIKHGDASFVGNWADGQATLSTNGTTVSGVWTPPSPRPAFSGVLVDGCTVSMDFPDDAPYQGTLVSACKIQWSYAYSTEIDPANFWIKDGCAPLSRWSQRDATKTPGATFAGCFICRQSASSRCAMSHR